MSLEKEECHFISAHMTIHQLNNSLLNVSNRVKIKQSSQLWRANFWQHRRRYTVGCRFLIKPSLEHQFNMNFALDSYQYRSQIPSMERGKRCSQKYLNFCWPWYTSLSRNRKRSKTTWNGFASCGLSTHKLLLKESCAKYTMFEFEDSISYRNCKVK